MRTSNARRVQLEHFVGVTETRSWRAGHGQQGLPITFGFKVAGWLAELRRHGERFAEIAQRMDVGQLCGGVGSLSALGKDALAVQRRFLERLGLRAPEISWTASRVLCESVVHDHERDGRSWKVEWHALPELTIAAGKALALLASLLEGLEVFPERMAANLEAARGYALSEGVMIALARRVGKQTAHSIVHSLLAAAGSENHSLRDAVMASPNIRAHLSEEELESLLDPAAQIGQCQALVDQVLAREDAWP